MALGYDGSVRIKADLNHSNFDRGLESMTGQVNKFGSTLKKLVGVIGLAFGTAALVNFGKESIKLASDIQEVQNVIDVTFGQGAEQIEEFAKSAAEAFGLSELSAKQYTGTMGAMLKSSGLATKEAQKMSVALAGLTGDLASFYNLETDMAFEKIRSGISGETEPLKQLGINMSVANLEAYALTKGITKSYNAMSQAEQVMLRYNYLLSVTGDAQGDFARTSDSLANQTRILSLNFNQLKIALGNALIPIAQAVLPGINAIIASLTKLATVFSKVTALLFGKSTQVKETTGVSVSAGAAAESTDKLADSLGAAGDAAKKAGKDMKSVSAPFDEFNIIADNAAGSASDLADGLDVGGADFTIPEFEADTSNIEAVGEEFKTLGELFLKTLDDMLAGIPALKDAFASFADSFNDFNQKLYDAFTFPGVKDRVEQLGKELAEAFNSLVNAIDWELWGRRLGAGLNLGLQFLTEFIYTFDWVGLGVKLAEFINGIVYEVDWYDFGRLLWSKFKIGLETFAGFITGLDMPALAQAASDIIMGFFNSMQETIANIDWSQIGAQIAEFLNNIDWAGVIEAFIGAAKEIVFAFLEGMAGFIANADPEILVAAAGILTALVVKKIINMVVVPIAKEFIHQVIQKIVEAISASGFTEIIFTIGKTIAGISTVLAGASLAVSSFVSMWNEGFSLAKEAVMLLGIALTAVGAIILGVPATVASVVAAIVAVIATAVIAVRENWDAVKEAFSSMMEHINQIVEGIKEKLQEWFDKMKEGWDTYIKPVLDNVIKKFKEVVEQNIKPLIEQAVKLIENVQKVVKALWDNVLSPFLEWLSNTMWKGISSTLENISDVVVTVIETITGVITGIIEVLNGVIDFLTGVFSGSWEEVFSGIEEIVSGAIKIVSNIISGFIGLVKNAIDALLDFIGVSDKASKAKAPSWSGNPRSGGFSSRNTYSMAMTDIPEVYSAGNLPRLANGAVIPPNRQFAAILGDQRSGVNIEAPLATIKQAVTEAMQSAGGFGGDINITVESVLDGKVIARNTINHVNSMTRSAGRSPLLGMG